MTNSDPKYQDNKIGVIFVNFGSPESLNYISIRRFLKNLLLDRRVVSLTRLLWLPILYGFILPFRPLALMKSYKIIWKDGASPLLYYQASLIKQLKERCKEDIVVESAMIYSNPSLQTAWSSLKSQGVREVVLFPMYPQYCSATTASVFDHWKKVVAKETFMPGLRFIHSYHDDPHYIAQIANSIRQHWKKVGRPDHMIFSYHGIPQRLFKQGDPYFCYCSKTTRLVSESLSLKSSDYTMSFQSRFGKEAWLKPYLSDVIKDKSRAHCRTIDIIMPGFSIDCVETLYEVGVEYREEAAEKGCVLRVIPCLNDHTHSVDMYLSILKKLKII